MTKKTTNPPSIDPEQIARMVGQQIADDDTLTVQGVTDMAVGAGLAYAAVLLSIGGISDDQMFGVVRDFTQSVAHHFKQAGGDDALKGRVPADILSKAAPRGAA